MERVRYLEKWRLGDRRSLLALTLLLGSACAWLGWSIDRDERSARRARSEHAAAVLARTVQGLTDGDWESRGPVLNRLARAVGPGVRLSVVEGTPSHARPFGGDRAYAAHSDPERVGKRLASASAEDGRLMQRLKGWQSARTEAVSTFWDDGRAVAFVAVGGESPLAVSVEGVGPAPGHRRAVDVAGTGFVVMLLLCAALMSWAPRAGPFLVLPVVAVGLWVVAALGAELDATLWLPRQWRPACAAVSETGFPAAAREICTKLSPEPSLVEQSTVACVALASLGFLAFLLVRLVLAWSARRRDRLLQQAAARASA